MKTFDTDCLVQFIDYNNIERVSYNKLHSSVICSEVPPFAHKFRLIGELPSPKDCENHKFASKKFCSVLHDYIVDKPIYLKVHQDDIAITDPNYSKRCSIEVDKEVFKTYYEFLEFSRDFHINADGSITSD